MKTKILFAAALIGLAVSLYSIPPASAKTWSEFFVDSASFQRKLVFIVGYYVWPAVVGFFATFLFQLQGRIMGTPGQTSKQLIFSMSLLAYGALWYTLGSLTRMGRPGMVAGMALGTTLASQVFAISMKRSRWIGDHPVIIWKWNPRAHEAFKRLMTARVVVPADAPL